MLGNGHFLFPSWQIKRSSYATHNRQYIQRHGKITTITVSLFMTLPSGVPRYTYIKRHIQNRFDHIHLEET